MNEQHTVVTRKGQVTIPQAIRRALNLQEGDTVVWMMEDGSVRLRRSRSVVARTAGMLKSKQLARSAEEERAAAEQAIADDVMQRGQA